MFRWEKQIAKKSNGFTIVELLIVIVVIAILAAITIVAYNGIRERAQDSSAKSAAQQALKKIEAYKTTNNNIYPADLATAGIVNSGGTTYGYSKAEFDTRACVWAKNGSSTFSIQTGSELMKGECGQVIASFYAGAGFTNPLLVRADANIANTWGTGSPDPLVPADNFASRFETKMLPPVTGTYTFYTTTDDSAELIVDGQTIIPWTASGVREATSTTINLTQDVPVSVVYSAREGGGSAYATLGWSYPGQATKVTIPATNYARP